MQLKRRLSHLLWKSKAIPLGVEHFLAMFPATVLVPITINALSGHNVVDTSLVLLTSGIGTIVFLLCSKLVIPTYIGSSFAYIGLTVFLLNNLSPHTNPELVYSYIGWAYIFGGLILVILSFLFKAKNAKEVFNFFLPVSVIGPAISLIGLELADSAAQDAGFVSNPIAEQGLLQLSATNSKLIAIFTLSIIILSTIARRKMMKNSAIVIGMIGGFVLSLILCENDVSFSMFSAATIRLPRLSTPFSYLPPNLLQLLVSVIPAALVVFTENISRVTVVTRMTDVSSKGSIFSEYNIKKFRTATLCHGVATFIAASLGSVPNTLYAENIAVMNTHCLDKSDDDAFSDEDDRFVKYVHNSFSCIPYFVAAVFAIIASLSGHLQQFLLNIPTPVLGGMKLFLFGIISAPGIQLLVEQRVDYKKISNQLLTASVLISGISGLTISLGVVELKGMSLGFTIGIIVNILIKSLDYFGRLNDCIELGELFQICVKEIPQDMILLKAGDRVYNTSALYLKNLLSEQCDSISIDGKELSAETLISMISDSQSVEFGFKERNAVLRLEKMNYALRISISQSNFNDSHAKKFLHDYSNDDDHAVELKGGDIHIRVGANVPLRIIREQLRLLHQFN